MKTQNSGKLRIGDLAKQLEVKEFVIRFWEREFKIKARRSAGGTWGTPTLVSASNDKGLGNVAGDVAGTFVIAWTNSAGAVEALTIPPGGSFVPGTGVGAGPFSALLVLSGEAVLSIEAGLSKETVQ